jgi:hypothetical protein
MVALEPRRRANSIYNYFLSYVDKVADADTRQRHYDRVSGFSQERPILASFLAVQIAFSLLPVALFLSFGAGVLLFTVCSAAAFAAFWIGAALLVLLPTLFVTLSLGFLFWIWALSTVIIARWIYSFRSTGQSPSETLTEIVQAQSPQSNKTQAKLAGPGPPSKSSSEVLKSPVPKSEYNYNPGTKTTGGYAPAAPFPNGTTQDRGKDWGKEFGNGDPVANSFAALGDGSIRAA